LSDKRNCVEDALKEGTLQGRAKEDLFAGKRIAAKNVMI
jgi:hypothetical protein